ncbi:MAG: T9SS type A sorting domain-containing protein [Bacteroidota bacterium]
MIIRIQIISIFLICTIQSKGQHYFNSQVLYYDPPDFSHLYDLKHGDLDNDGDNDLVAYSRVNGLIWLRNDDGKLVYHKSSILSSGSSGFDVELSDLDMDGDLDVVTNRGWYRNTDGQGKFRFAALFPSIDSPGDLACGDFDGDGDDDVVVLSDDKIYIYYNQNSVFEEELIFEDLGNTEFLEVLDANHDNRLDFISLTGIVGNGFSIFYNEEDGFIRSGSQAVFGITSLDIGDINGDGLTDVCTGSTINTEIRVRLGRINGGFEASQVLVSDVDPLDIHLADFNGDDYADIYARNGTLIYNPEAESYDITGFSSGSNGQLLAAYAFDIDGDGLDDKVQGRDDQVSVSYNNADNAFTLFEDVIIRFPENVVFTDFFDFDGDQDLDIVLNSGWLPYDHTTGQYLPYKGFNGRGKLFDFNMDGNLDLVSSGGGASVFLGTDVPEEFEFFASVGGSGTSSSDYADIDGDGDTDIVIRRSSRYEWYRNEDGQGTFSDAIDIQGDIFTGDFKLGDYDNDGDIDIIGATPQTGRTAFYENLDGLGSFSSSQQISDTRFQRIDLIDIDENGFLDVVLMNNFPISVTLLKNTSSGLLPPITVAFPAFDELLSVKMRDFDLDGDLDYIANTEDNKIYFVESIDFANTFNPPVELISNGGDGIRNTFDVGDFDGDGHVDLVSLGERSREILLHRATTDSTNTLQYTLNTNFENEECKANSSNKVFLFKITDELGQESFIFLGPDKVNLVTTTQGLLTTELYQKLPEYYQLFQDKAITEFCGVGNTDSLRFCLSPTSNAVDFGASIFPLSKENADTLNFLVAIENNSTLSASSELSFFYPESLFEIAVSELPYTDLESGELRIQLEEISPLTNQSFLLKLVPKDSNETLPDVSQFAVSVHNVEDIAEMNDSISIAVPKDTELNLVNSTKGNFIKWQNRGLPVDLILSYPAPENEETDLLLKYHWPDEMDLSTLNILYSEDSLGLVVEENTLLISPAKRDQSIGSNDGYRNIVITANLISEIQEASVVNIFVELIDNDEVLNSMTYPIEIGKQCPEGELLISSQADVLSLVRDWPDCNQVSGGLRIESQEELDLSKIQSVNYIEGDLIIEESTHQPTLAPFVASIDTIMGDLAFIRTAQEGSLEINNVRVGTFRADECQMLDSIVFEAGNIISSNSSMPGFFITNNDSLSYLLADPINSNVLDGQSIIVSNNPLLESAELLFRNKEMTGNIEIVDNAMLRNVSNFSSLDYLNGSLHIEGNEQLEEVATFWTLENISGSVEYILNNPIDTIAMFWGLRTIGGNLTMKFPQSKSLRSFVLLRSVDGDVNISLRDGLVSYEGLRNLREVGGVLRFTNENHTATSTEVFQRLERVNESLFLNEVDSLSFNNLSNLVYVGDSLSITNSAMSSLTPLSQLDFNVLHHVEMVSNSFLTQCNTTNFCEFLLENETVTVNIDSNEEGCNSEEEVLNLCFVSTSEDEANDQEILKNNVVDQYLFLEDHAIDSEVEVLSFSGAVLLKQNSGTQLNCNHLPKGMYLARVKKGKWIAVEKFIKQ